MLKDKSKAMNKLSLGVFIVTLKYRHQLHNEVDKIKFVCYIMYVIKRNEVIKMEMSVWGWLAVGLFFAGFIFIVVMGFLLTKD